MKKLFNSSFRVFVIMLSLSATIFLASCSKDDDNPVDSKDGNNNQTNTITINGGGYNNQVVTLAGAGGYATTSNVTIISLTGVINTTPVNIVLATPGNAAGTHNWLLFDGENTSGALIGFTPLDIVDTTKIFISTGANGSTTITSYGNVSQTITGTFSGNLMNTAGTQISVTGKFSVLRGPDEDE